MAFGMGPVVRLTNRVIDEKGERVPYTGTIGGEAVIVRDTLDVPLGVARILIHQSMYKMDPVSGVPSYRLGCKDLDITCADLPVNETRRAELLERELLPESQKGKTQFVKLHNPINPGLSRAPISTTKGGDDGALPGEFGYRD